MVKMGGNRAQNDEKLCAVKYFSNRLYYHQFIFMN
jgi:hypothetical protein